MTIGLRTNTSVFFVAQLVTSATNFVITLAMSRALVPAEFGKVAVGLTLGFFLVSFQRTVVGDTLLIFARQREGLVGQALATCGALGLTLGIVAVIFAVAAPNWVPWFIATALPLLLIQDGFRYIAVAVGRSRTVLASDTTWFLAALVALGLSLRGRDIGIVAGVWLFGGLLAIGVLLVGARRRPGEACFVSPTRFFRSTADVSGWMTVQYLVGNGAVQLAMVSMAIFTGTAAYGGYRAVQLLVAPVMTVVLASISPLMSWVGGRSNFRWTFRLLVGFCTSFVVLAALPGLVLVRSGPWLLVTIPGPAYAPYVDLILPSVLAVVVVAAAVPPAAVLRGHGQGRRLLVSGLLGTIPGAIAISFAAWRWGILAATWAFVAMYVATFLAGLQLATMTIREANQDRRQARV